MNVDAPNINYLWAQLIVEELVRNGVTKFWIAPGSRSSPLAWAAADHPDSEVTVHFDERGNAFAALGYARATRKPAVWITSSGTAVANGLPAVLEADHDRVPLLMLTADRPPELRDTDANQTTTQSSLLSRVRWQYDFPVPTEAVDPALVLSSIDYAISRTAHPRGPVHVNVPFREPLTPSLAPYTLKSSSQRFNRWLSGDAPFTSFPDPVVAPAPETIQELANNCTEPCIIVAGKIDSHEETEAVLQLARRLNWPVIPDAGSQLRLVSDNPVISYADLALVDSSFARRNRPGTVLQFGSRVTSKRILEWISSSAPETYAVIKPHPYRTDSNVGSTHQIYSSIPAFCREFGKVVDRNRLRTSATPIWIQKSDDVKKRLNAAFQRLETLTEPAAIRAISQLIPSDSGLFLSSSMPIRDFDSYADTSNGVVTVAANRGLSGIDGTIASTVGFSTGLKKPVTLIVGDLAFLHDLNSLQLVREAEFSITIVVINNDGGGIFSFLPIAEHKKHFDSMFGTPHGRHFSSAADLFGIKYDRPESLPGFEESYTRATSSGESAIIEVVTDRQSNHEIHRQLLEAVI